MVSMEVLKKSTEQWCPNRCVEGNDIDIGVLGILQKKKYKSQCIWILILILQEEQERFVGRYFFLNASNLRSERWRRAAVMNFMADGTRLEMFCICITLSITFGEKSENFCH